MLLMGNLSHKRQDLFSGVCSMVGKTDDRLLTEVQSGVGTGAVGARVGRTEGLERQSPGRGSTWLREWRVSGVKEKQCTVVKDT